MKKYTVIVKSDKDEADVEAEKLKQKGFSVTGHSQARQVVLNGSDLGGHLDLLIDADNEVFLIIGEK